jgi:hydroxyacylglutathione hydrolase
MIVERSLNPQFVSNTYLVADEPGGTAAFVDAGGPVAPLLDKVDELGVTVSHVLLTHHHHDHVCELDRILARHPDSAVLIHEREPFDAATGRLVPGEPVTVGALRLEPMHTPGHTAGMVALVVGDEGVFTGDTLFRESVGGVRAPGSTSFEDLRSSILDGLLGLPSGMTVYPGHTELTTIEHEAERNPFVRIWRGLDPEGDEPCLALGEPATLILRARDYDGGTKAWVRWPDGSDDIVPGSRVEAGGG